LRLGQCVAGIAAQCWQHSRLLLQKCDNCCACCGVMCCGGSRRMRSPASAASSACGMLLRASGGWFCVCRLTGSLIMSLLGRLVCRCMHAAALCVPWPSFGYWSQVHLLHSIRLTEASR
jgi:hypothetical protein